MKDLLHAPIPTSRGPWLATLPSAARRHALARMLLRFAAAGPLFFHGSQKLFGWFGGSGIAGFAGYLEALGAPIPTLNAVLAALSEVSGALLLAFGLGGWALAPVAFTMLVAVLASLRNGFDVAHGGVEFPLTVLLVVVASSLLTRGPSLPFGSKTARRPS